VCHTINWNLTESRVKDGSGWSGVSRKQQRILFQLFSDFHMTLVTVVWLGLGKSWETATISNTPRWTGDFREASASNSLCAACRLPYKAQPHSEEWASSGPCRRACPSTWPSQLATTPWGTVEWPWPSPRRAGQRPPRRHRRELLRAAWPQRSRSTLLTTTTMITWRWRHRQVRRRDARWSAIARRSAADRRSTCTTALKWGGLLLMIYPCGTAQTVRMYHSIKLQQLGLLLLCTLAAGVVD